MDRKRNLGMIVGTVAIALGAGQYLQSGSAQSAASMTPMPMADSPPPLRLAAGTPLAAHEPTTPEVIPVLAKADPPPAPLAPVLLPDPAPQAEAPACPITLDLFANDGAILSLSLTAPCRPDQGFVLRHGSIAVTYQTNASGSFFLDLPALDPEGEVSLRFADGTEAVAAAPLPDLADHHRLALQWLEGDSFTLSGDGPIVSLGVDATVLPMYAQIITLPTPDAPLTIEAPVTATTCGREAMALAVLSEGGRITLSDLSIGLPDCDAEGGFVVLNNPVPDMKLAAQN